MQRPDGETRHPWRVAHDALAAHGRARIAKRPEGELQSLWQDYCIALDAATTDQFGRDEPQP